jgi:hypothetical protein
LQLEQLVRAPRAQALLPRYIDWKRGLDGHFGSNWSDMIMNRL